MGHQVGDPARHPEDIHREFAEGLHGPNSIAGDRGVSGDRGEDLDLVFLGPLPGQLAT